MNIKNIPRLIIIGFLAVVVFSFSVPAMAQSDLFISNATIITGTGEVIENGSVLIRNGKIEAVGKDLTAPNGVRVVDATGQFVMPGIIDYHSHLGMETVNEATDKNTSMTDITDVVKHDDYGMYRALAAGVTTIHQLHGSANPVGGRDEVVKLKWGRSVEEIMVKGNMEGLKFALGENPLRVYGEGPNYAGRSRMDNEFVIRDYFVKAQEYRRKWREYELKRSGKLKPENEMEKKFGPVPPKKDIRLETMAGVLEGTIRSHIHSYTNSEIAMFAKLGTDFGFKPTSYEHVLEGYMVSNEMEKHGSVASIFVDNWNYKVEAAKAIPFMASLLTERGVRVAINSDSPDIIRRLNLDAAKTIRYGDYMNETEAIKSITEHAAFGMRLQDRIGSLEIGKDGDVAIFDGDPLSVYSKCIKTIIEGEIFFDREKALTTDKWIKGETKDKKITEGEAK